jgi:hypothetical protein
VSGKPTQQIDLPVSPKLKVKKFVSLLDVIIISTKLANCWVPCVPVGVIL